MTIRSIAAATTAALVVLAGPAQAGPVSTSPVFEFLGSGHVPSEAAYSTLTRRPQFIDVEIESDNLDPDTAYTVWAIIFNHSTYCASMPCGLNSLPILPGHDPRVRASAQYLTGGYSDNDGKVHFIGRLYVPERGVQPVETLFGPGLLRPFRAEVHFIIRGHGQPAVRPIAFQSYLSGCEETGACSDDQVSVHTPANP